MYRSSPLRSIEVGQAKILTVKNAHDYTYGKPPVGIKKLLIMLPIALYVVKNLGTLIRLKKRPRNTKKFVTIAILQVGIEVVLIAFAI